MKAAYFRNFILGVEDSLVSTVGLLSGVAIAGVARETILLTGIVLIFVEAFAMAAGSFLSEASTEELASHHEASSSRPFIASTIMFGSYFLAGFVPLFPYIVFMGDGAFTLSIVMSVVALFSLGLLSAYLSKTPLIKSALRMMLVGGIAIGVGAAVGSFLNLA